MLYVSWQDCESEYILSAPLLYILAMNAYWLELKLRENDRWEISNEKEEARRKHIKHYIATVSFVAASVDKM